MRRSIQVGDRVVVSKKYLLYTGMHGVVIDRTERGHGIGYGTLRVKLDNGTIFRDSISYFHHEKEDA